MSRNSSSSAPDPTVSVPVRTCVGCKQRSTKSDLLRVVAGDGPNGLRIVVPDPTSTAAGRGAHVHPTSECHELAVRRRAYPRALRLTGVAPADQVGEYLASLKQGSP